MDKEGLLRILQSRKEDIEKRLSEKFAEVDKPMKYWYEGQLLATNSAIDLIKLCD